MRRGDSGHFHPLYGRQKHDSFAKIVFAADYIEEGRDFDGLDRIRQAVYDDIDKGIKLIYENTIAFFACVGTGSGASHNRRIRIFKKP